MDGKLLSRLEWPYMHAFTAKPVCIKGAFSTHDKIHVSSSHLLQLLFFCEMIVGQIGRITPIGRITRSVERGRAVDGKLLSRLEWPYMHAFIVLTGANCFYQIYYYSIKVIGIRGNIKLHL